MEAELIDPAQARRVPVRGIVSDLLEACLPHALDLGCGNELERVRELSEATGATRQLDLARGSARLPGLVEDLAERFSAISDENAEPPGRASRPGSRAGDPV
jgi:gamma-glutamyl:cysteine ligase YbdK (ATP-grasp superfamily)